ncbi:MAG: SpoIID/LytB domain-containing protein [Candidatus Hydrothermia bacterium]
MAELYFDEYRIEDEFTKFVRTEKDSGYFTGDIILKSAGNYIFIQNVVAEEDYVASCTQFLIEDVEPPEEYVKAVAVVIRTFVYHLAVNNIFFLPDSLPYWVYKGVGNLSSKVKKAAEETHGEVLLYLNSPIYPLITYCTGGFTVFYEEIFGDSIEYSVSVDDSYSSSCAYYNWEIKVPVNRIQHQLNLGRIDSIEVKNYTIHMIPDTILIFGDKTYQLRGVNLFQSLYPLLPSPLFQMEVVADTIIFNGKGKGHLIGLSLWGSKAMAVSGKNYKEILEHYFPVAILSKMKS